MKINFTLRKSYSKAIKHFTTQVQRTFITIPSPMRIHIPNTNKDIEGREDTIAIGGIDALPLDAMSDQKKIVIEYSSPNIAKPFHVGHLRSTIIGNFISNLYEYFSYSVQRINYLGDWGTQFGLLKVGLDLSGFSQDIIKKNPIQCLFEAYVLANQRAEIDSSISERAREVFQQLEEGNLPILESWKTYRNYTVEELQKVYQRLGVRFDEYNWESDYGAKDVESILDLLEEKGILKVQTDGKKVAEISEDRHVPVVKSDGSTLYLTRDIAAAIDRHKRHNFQEMLYVVDNSQTDHFTALFGILSKMNLPWAHTLRHVKFGRVQGMSTRKGNVVFLKDVLDEIKDVMQSKQLESKTTKIPLGNLSEDTADILGISSMIISDLKQRRQRDYEFNWNKALQVQGDTGVRLQYTHCRLWSLERNSGATLPLTKDSIVLQEPQAKALAAHLNMFIPVLQQSRAELESCILVNYLFQLCNFINRAFKVLKIKNQDDHLASQRLLLFHNSRMILNQGMTILGLQPLNKM